MEQMSFVSACQDFFSKPPFGKKVSIPEFKELSRQDKIELRNMLIDQGYNVAEFPPPKE